jgi:hypothetical protein
VHVKYDPYDVYIGRAARGGYKKSLRLAKVWVPSSDLLESSKSRYKDLSLDFPTLDLVVSRVRRAGVEAQRLPVFAGLLRRASRIHQTPQGRTTK